MKVTTTITIIINDIMTTIQFLIITLLMMITMLVVLFLTLLVFTNSTIITTIRIIINMRMIITNVYNRTVVNVFLLSYLIVIVTLII